MEEKRFTDSLFYKAFCAFLFVTLIFFVLIYFKDLLKPLMLGVFFWYLIKAFNGLIEKIKIRGRPLNIWLRRAIALLIIAGIVEVSIELFVSSVGQIINNFDKYQASLDAAVVSIGDYFGFENFTAAVKERISDLDIPGFLRGVLASASTVLGNLFLVLVYTIFILLEEGSFVKKLSLLLHGPGQEEKMTQIIDRIYSNTNRYMAVKALVSVLTALLSYGVLFFIGVDFAFLWSLLIFALNFIPYIGSLIATFLPAAFAIVQFGSPWPFVWVFVSITIIQVIIGNYVEPKVMGKSLNLSPLVVLFALAFWGTVWDLLGMLLSVPITSIMLITFAQFPATQSLAILLTENGDISDLQIKDEP